jgi:hypothetical protein
MPFVPGQIANPNGVKREKQFLDNLKRAIAQDNAVRLRAAAERVLDMAAAGEPWAVNFLADRLDGKPVQQVDVEGEVIHRNVAELPAVPTTADEWANRYQPTRQ